MTEKEYIAASDLERLKVVAHLLKEIIPGIPGIIDRQDHRLMLVKVNQWIKEYYNHILDE